MKGDEDAFLDEVRLYIDSDEEKGRKLSESVIFDKEDTERLFRLVMANLD